MKNKKNKIDKHVRRYFNILEEELGFSGLYEENTDESIAERVEMNYKYFKAGFLFANIDIK